jgi:hypothetical protein
MSVMAGYHRKKGDDNKEGRRPAVYSSFQV